MSELELADVKAGAEARGVDEPISLDVSMASYIFMFEFQEISSYKQRIDRATYVLNYLAF